MIVTPDLLPHLPPRIRDIYLAYCDYSEYAGWEFDWNGKRLSFIVPDGGGMCDFCGPGGSGPYSVWDADNVILLRGDETVDGVPQESVGPWHACVDCTPLVAGGDRDALIERALRVMRQERPAHYHPLVVAHMRGAHAAFWRAKR